MAEENKAQKIPTEPPGVTPGVRLARMLQQGPCACGVGAGGLPHRQPGARPGLPFKGFEGRHLINPNALAPHRKTTKEACKDPSRCPHPYVKGQTLRGGPLLCLAPYSTEKQTVATIPLQSIQLLFAFHKPWGTRRDRTHNRSRVQGPSLHRPCLFPGEDRGGDYCSPPSLRFHESHAHLQLHSDSFPSTHPSRTDPTSKRGRLSSARQRHRSPRCPHTPFI